MKLKKHPLKLINLYLINSHQPCNLSYLWNFGSFLATCFVIKIITGITLVMHAKYKNDFTNIVNYCVLKYVTIQLCTENVKYKKAFETLSKCNIYKILNTSEQTFLRVYKLQYEPLKKPSFGISAIQTGLNRENLFKDIDSKSNKIIITNIYKTPANLEYIKYINKSQK